MIDDKDPWQAASTVDIQISSKRELNKENSQRMRDNIVYMEYI